jgi:methylenetetrahydrofolate--tRNA-(uracil-5-)-methyltransferase
MDRVFWGSRYTPGDGDYVNCPLDRGEYEQLWHALTSAEAVPLKAGEEARYFEGCLPIEVIARRGMQTLAFGPMKPVGLVDPRTGKQPYAVVQLRREDLQGSFYNMVGFQTKLTWPEQRRVFRMIPGLERAEFDRYGSVHRNTFINGPAILNEALQMKTREDIFFAGQITGVEGYVESAACGMLAGMSVLDYLSGREMSAPPATTAMGALLRHVTTAHPRPFQPSNVNFSLFPSLPGKVRRREKGERYARRAIVALAGWISERAGAAEDQTPGQHCGAKRLTFA